MAIHRQGLGDVVGYHPLWPHEITGVGEYDLVTVVTRRQEALAVILGHVALSQIRRRGEGGRNLAITGLILGYGSLLAWFVLIVSMVTAELPAIEVPGVGTVEV